MNSIDRRTFLKLGSLGAAAMATGSQTHAVAQGDPQKLEPVFRTLGRTNLKVSVVSVGAMRTTEPAILQAAFDRGVNYVDTARGYQNGRNEAIVGDAIQGRRDKLIVATKFKNPDSKQEVIDSAETSLKELKTDYIDILQYHMPKAENALNPYAKEALAELKQQGKIRFTGVTTHSEIAAVIDNVINDPDKFYDVLLVAYNFKSEPEIKDAIARAAKANLGVIAMKTQAGGYETKELGEISPHQAALKFVLQDTNIANAIPAMVDLQQVLEDTEVMGMLEMSRAEAQALRVYGKAIDSYYCHRCGACTSTCPVGVDIQTVNRALMYAEGYHDLALAKSTYQDLPLAVSASACNDCASCSAKCAHGLDIASRMGKARTLFA